MKTRYLAIALAAAGMLALGAAAEAGSKGLGGGGGAALSAPAAAPAGFASGGEHKGFETFANGQTGPRGWDEGKAEWKQPLVSGGAKAPTTLPPGLTKH